MSKNEIAVCVEEQYPVLSNADEMREVIEANLSGDLSPGDLPRISFPTSGSVTFTVSTPEGDRGVESIEGIITAYQDVRGYWPGGFKGDNPPDCSSNDQKTGHGEPGGDCKTCPMALWDDTVEKSKGKPACKESRRLYIILPGHILPTMISVPPTSLKAIKKYFVSLTVILRPYFSVITKINLRQEKNSDGVKYGAAEFTLVGELSPEAGQTIKLMGQQYLNALGNRQE